MGYNAVERGANEKRRNGTEREGERMEREGERITIERGGGTEEILVNTGDKSTSGRFGGAAKG